MSRIHGRLIGFAKFDDQVRCRTKLADDQGGCRTKLVDDQGGCRTKLAFIMNAINKQTV